MEAKASPSALVDQLVVPGDVILDLSNLTSQTIKLGGGLRQDGDAISVMKAGTLRFTKPNKYWVESSNKRNFIVDVKGPALAHLPVLSFEGGTRRNIPKFEVGTLLYVRVVSANTGMNPELSCMDANGKAGEYGILKEGYMFESSTGLARQLLSSPSHLVLEGLGKKLSFEIAVGINGRFWVNASQSSTVILVGNAIQKSESLSMVQQKIYLDKLLKSIQ
ncbi:putative exosome complex component rrp40 [Tanacetum coccineum]